MDSLKDRMRRKKGGEDTSSARPTRLPSEQPERLDRMVDQKIMERFKGMKLTSMSFPGPPGRDGPPGTGGTYTQDATLGIMYNTMEVVPYVATGLAVQNAVTYAIANGYLRVRLIPGITYVIADTGHAGGAAILANVAAGKALQISCDGQCTFDDSSFTVPQSCIRIVQPSGDTFPNLIKGILFTGVLLNSRHIELVGCCGTRVLDCHFSTGAMGVYFHNTAAGVFTEDCVIEYCRWASDCTTKIWYGTEGDQSFRGSGVRNSVMNIAAADAIHIGPNAKPYESPLDGLFMSHTGSVGVDLSLINKTSAGNIPASFYGTLKPEAASGRIFSVAEGTGNIAWSGRLIGNDLANFHLGNASKLDEIEFGASGTIGGIGSVNSTNFTTLTTGANVLITIRGATQVIIQMRTGGGVYLCEYELYCHDQNGSNGVVNVVCSPIETDTGNVIGTVSSGDTIFSMNSSGVLSVTNANFPASGLPCWLDIRSKGQSWFASRIEFTTPT